MVFMLKLDKNDGKWWCFFDGKILRLLIKIVKMVDNEIGLSSGVGVGSGLVDKMIVIVEVV